MALVRIRSLDDPRLAPFQNLKATNATRWTETFVAEGAKLVERLLAAQFDVVSLLVDQRHLADFAAHADRLSILVVPDDWIETLVGFNFHRGVLACARRKPAADLWPLLQRRSATVVVCPDVQDPENLGGILRNASALGVDAVLLGDHCCDPWSRRVLRVSMGGALRVPLRVTPRLAEELTELAGAGLQLWATVVDAAATPFDRLSRPRHLALLLGSEGHGLAPRWLDACHERITIPMRPGVDSLNVSLAAGILLYHLTR
jgi:tRNA G18 (ribose-2'-O)-methylase SpoU